MKDLRLHALGEAEHVDRTDDARLRRLDRIELVVDGRGRAGEIVDLVDLDLKGEGHIVAHQLEIAVFEKRRNVAASAGEEIVDAEDLVAFPQEQRTEMRAKKTCSSGYKDPFS